MSFTSSKNHEIQIKSAGIIKQVILSLSNPMSIVREVLSNSCAKEVGATKVKITHFYDKDYGYSWEFEDDGCGMFYSDTDDSSRLNKFLNIGFSSSAGISTDEYGEKGLGSKLCYASKKLIIETYPKDKTHFYKVEVDSPYDSISKKNPEIPEPQIFELKNIHGKSGTKISVLGYMGGADEYKCSFNEIKNYLLTKTVAGCTDKGVIIPTITLKTAIDGREKELIVTTGYPFIKKPNDDKGKVVVIDAITVEESTSEGEKVVVTLKGGYFILTETSKVGFLSQAGGLKFSMNNIPYFDLYLSEYKGNCDFMNNGKDSVFVIECNDLDLDMGREDFIFNAKAEAFTKATKNAFKIIENTDDYRNWKSLKIKEKKKQAGTSLNERIDELKNGETKWVYVDEYKLHKVPNSEHDTLAILWKLEGMNKIPMTVFRTLEHTKQTGIDIIADCQWDDISAKKVFVPIEVEYKLENFLKHDHEATQAPLIICWEIENENKLIKQNLLIKTEKNYKYSFMGSDVLVLSKFDFLSIK